jgi:hypothetical protein
MPVNVKIRLPEPPGPHVDARKCVCGAEYAHFRHGSWQEAVGFVRQANGGFDGGGGFRSRGPVLWAWRVVKLGAWYDQHAFCGDRGASGVDRTPVDPTTLPGYTDLEPGGLW